MATGELRPIDPSDTVDIPDEREPDDNIPDAVADVCRHCGRTIERIDGIWVDPEADGDDSIWRETCDQNDAFIAHHEPRPDHVLPWYVKTVELPESMIVVGPAGHYSLDEARRLANAILFEIEIAERERTGDW